MLDAVIIGKGPAGVSAALYLQRAGFKTLIAAKDNGALEKAEKIENYYGIKSISGTELIKLGEEQVFALGVEIISAEITGITFDGSYTVTCADGEYRTKTVIIATGASRKKSSVKNSERFEGAGVSYCAVCDAFFYRGKPAAVLGNGSYALHEAKELSLCSELYLLTNGAELDLSFPEKIKTITTPVSELIGNERLEGVRFDNGETIAISGLFVAEGVADGADFARTLGLTLENGSIKVDAKMKTPAPGVFAAGDITGGVKQISVAVGEGAIAALSAIEYIRANQK